MPGRAPSSKPVRQYDARAHKLSRLERDDVEVGHLLGEGATKVVHRGTLHGLEVAIAMVRGDITNFQAVQKEFVAEAQLTARFLHPNIMEVYGQVGTLRDKKPIWILFESCGKGSLQNFKYPSTGRLFVESLYVSISALHSPHTLSTATPSAHTCTPPPTPQG